MLKHERGQSSGEGTAVLHDLSLIREDEGFRASSTPRMVLDDELVIRAVNQAFLQMTQRVEEELLSLALFDAFPDNADDPDNNGPTNLAVSLQRVLRDGRGHHMLVQRYDVRDRVTGKFQPRYWVPVNLPVHDGDGVVGVQQRVTEVRPPTAGALRTVRALIEALPPGCSIDEDAEQVAPDRLAAAVADLDAAVREADQLREALVSRATIEQAKGIVMARDGLPPDEAWARLVRLSNDTNVRVADVASALVYQVTRQDPAPARADDAGRAGSG